MHALETLRSPAFASGVCPDPEAVARPKRDSRCDSNAVISVGVQEAPFAPWQAPQRPPRVLRWLLLISGLGFDSLAAH